ncbi:MAG: DUF4364 family protein [Eubacteriales bacterium]|nr:DUF4364 family protein [Eubacteriales bacterium]
MEANTNEAKLILLAILKELPGLSPAELQSLAQDTLFFDYFTIAEALSTLSEQKLVSILEAKNELRRDASGRVRQSCYLTAAGEAVLDQLSGQISLPVRKQIKALSKESKAASEVNAFYQMNGHGSYDTYLEIKDQGQTLLSIHIDLPEEARARKFCDHWPNRAADIYRFLLADLSRDE